MTSTTHKTPKTTKNVPAAAGKQLRGRVVKANMVGTITVKVDRFVQHPKYKKYYSIGKKYLVDDASAEGKVGDLVEIVETRPISKLKRFRLVSVVEKVRGVDLADAE